MSFIAPLRYGPVDKLMTKYVAPQHDKEDGGFARGRQKADYSAADKLLFP